MFCLKLFPEISETTVWFDTGPVKDLVTSYLCTQCDGKRASESMGTWFRASCFPIFSVPIFLSPMNLKLFSLRNSKGVALDLLEVYLQVDKTQDTQLNLNFWINNE